MSQVIDRAGIFRVRPLSWHIYKSENSKSFAVNMRFQVLEMFLENVWTDWMVYGDWHVFGSYWIVGKEGKINSKIVDQLARSLGWKGDLAAVKDGPPPDVIVQVRVEEETYKGQARYKAGWMNPGDYVPDERGEDEESVRMLDAQFGSALRAAAASAAKPAPKPAEHDSIAPIDPVADERSRQ